MIVDRVVPGVSLEKMERRVWGDGALYFGLALHFGFLLCVPYVFDPEDSKSTGVHEAVGFNDAECSMRAQDLQGWSRSLYMCKNITWYYAVCDPPIPKDGSVVSRSWYTLCGTPFAPGWRAGTTGVEILLESKESS